MEGNCPTMTVLHIVDSLESGKEFLAAHFHSQHIIISARTKSINKNMVAGFQFRQFAQERDHVLIRADVAGLAHQPGHGQDNPFVMQVLFFKFVNLVISVMHDSNS